MFTRRHFEAIAEIIRSNSNIVGESNSFDKGAKYGGACIAQDLSDLFKEDNPQFDESRFFQACGLTK